jgi:cytochrome P450
VTARQEALRAAGGVLEIEAQDDLVGALLLANEEGLAASSAADAGKGAHAGRSGLTTEDIVLFITTLIVAGNETSTFLSGHALHVLASMPEVQAELRADRSKMNNFLDETMRLYGPVQRLFRWVLADTEVGGVPIKSDEWVAVFYGAANRDPAVFDDPHRFDLNRPNARAHTSLGHGIHYCLGALLARLNVSTMVNAVLDRYTQIELAGEPMPQTVNIFNFAYWELPLSFTH